MTKKLGGDDKERVGIIVHKDQFLRQLTMYTKTKTAKYNYELAKSQFENQLNCSLLILSSNECLESKRILNLMPRSSSTKTFLTFLTSL